jgi:hypothetical protein
MKIQELFSKDISRAINGVVKAEQMDILSVWQELDEFVVTKELLTHFDRFFSVYSDSIDQPDDIDISGNIGVWVSGFFGSGKSHFIKALSYLFKNNEVEAHGDKKKAIEFFEDKIDDSLLLGTIKRVVVKNADVILFNIDSKADQSKGRDAILAVFLKVLNELQGYSPDHPHIAHMERYLEQKNKLETFHKIFNELVGSSWDEQRDNYMFNQDEIVKALSQTLGQSEEASHRWIDHAETDFSLTVENFTRWVKEYLNSKGAEHRIFFFVDEIGQFIGQDGHLMLNLQTIIEDLGVACSGRAWVVVTSQEDIDKVLGSLSNTQMNDFSKIQGRFRTRLSLSSANTDEVIQTRILEKKEEYIDELRNLYLENADILKNQLSFTNVGMTLLSYNTEDDFIKSYPFIPYQFTLLQKVFETIRRAGATGLHLSRGERSMLDAFKYAGEVASHKELGVLVPLYWFYPSIESFLDTAVKRTIVQAHENPSLHEFDESMLQTLFMIRYIVEIKGSVDNLVTLCIDSIDADRFALRKTIEESLHRLEKETLIARSGENYFFLTNEEQDVSREIKNVELDLGAENRLLGDIIFEDIYKDTKKHRYAKTGKDFNINRLCDKRPIGNRVEQGLVVSVITPFNDVYSQYNQSRCALESMEEDGSIVIKLSDIENLETELRIYLKTEKYISRKNDENQEIKRILRDRKEDNRIRKNRLMEFTKEMLADADYYVAGQKRDMDADPLTALGEAGDYLIDNTFTKMGYIEHKHPNQQTEVQAVLRADNMVLNIPEYNLKAIEVVREYVDLCTRTSKQIVMHELVCNKFANRPYGWMEWDTILLLARMIVAGEINLVMNSAIIERQRIYEIISKTSNWKKVTLRQRNVVDTKILEIIRRLGQDLFGEMGPDNEDGLFAFFKDKVVEWDGKLNQYKALADTGDYPGGTEIGDGIRLVSVLVSINESSLFMQRINESKDELKDFSDDFHDIDNFYKTQRPVWERLRKGLTRFQLNDFELEKDDASAKALGRMREILKAPAPYRLISEIDVLIKTVNDINEKLLEGYRKDAILIIDKLLDDLSKEAEKVKQDKTFVADICEPLTMLRKGTETQESIAHIKQIGDRARDVFDTQIQRLLEQTEPEGPGGDPPVKKVKEIRAGRVANKAYLETEDDVEEFLRGLKKEIDEAIKSGNRIRII